MSPPPSPIPLPTFPFLPSRPLLLGTMSSRGAAPTSSGSVGRPPPRGDASDFSDVLLHPSRLSLSMTDANLLGAGAFGAVYAATMDGSAVAVKVTRLRSGRAAGGAALGGAPPSGTSVAGAAAKAARRAARSAAAQFHREVRRYARLRHPGIVQFLGVVDGHPAAPGELLLVTELMDGGNLLENLRGVRRAGARLDDRSLLHLAAEVAWAVVYLHREGFSNGDLKSLNVALTEEIHAATGGFDRSAHAKLIDFGLSRALAPDTLAETVADSVNDLSTSTPSSAAGTLHYLSPEALRSPILQCDPALARKGDVYALGVVLYELLTTLPPWAGVNPATIPTAVFRAERPAWPPALATDAAAAAVSPAVGLVRELAEACWAQDPDARPDADVVAARLDAAARALGPDTRPRRAAGTAALRASWA